MSSRLILKSVSTDEDYGVQVLVTTYRVENSTPGRDGVTVFQDLVIRQGLNEGAKASMNIEDMEPQPTVHDALDKIASWLELMAAAIRSREVKTTLEIFK